MKKFTRVSIGPKTLRNLRISLKFTSFLNTVMGVSVFNVDRMSESHCRYDHPFALDQEIQPPRADEITKTSADAPCLILHW